jgi:glycine cleavage system H protein
MNIPKELKYTDEHEWAKLEGEIAVIGITDYAQERLGDVVFVELPEIGTETEKGEAFCVVESVKAASDIYAPMSGEIAEINKNLEDHPELVNQSPYGEGWMVRIKVTDPAEIEDLMSSDRYRKYVEEQEESE